MNVLKKKLGAGLLSLAMLAGGGLHIVSADSVTQEGITIEGDNERSVVGYQTEVPDGYAANVTWGSMIFVYDKGGYSTTTGLSNGKTTNVPGVEMGGTDEAVNQWYGFNGENNKVKVENLSTGAITVDAVATPDEQAPVTDLSLSLYKAVAGSSSDDDALAGVSHSAGTGNKWVAWSATNVPAADRDSNDVASVAADNTAFVEAYLNLTGTPTDDLINRDDLTEQVHGDVLGSITLSLTRVVSQNP